MCLHTRWFFGKKCRTYLDVVYDTWTKSGFPSDMKADDAKYLQTLQENIELVRKAANLYAENKEAQYMQQYNKHASNKTFQEGDLVLVLMPDSTNNLKSKWLGPGVVVHRRSKNTYLVALDGGGVKLLHADKLRKFISRVANIGVVNYDADVDFGNVVECPVYLEGDEFEKKLNKLDLSNLSNEQRNKFL